MIFPVGLGGPMIFDLKTFFFFTGNSRDDNARPTSAGFSGEFCESVKEEKEGMEVEIVEDLDDLRISLRFATGLRGEVGEAGASMVAFLSLILFNWILLESSCSWIFATCSEGEGGAPR